MRFFVALIVALLSACTAPNITPQPKAGDTHQLPPIEWRIVDRAELERVYTGAGMTLAKGQELQGFAAKQGGRTVVYTLAPRRVDDAATLTLGHEVMHVALGDYHAAVGNH